MGISRFHPLRAALLLGCALASTAGFAQQAPADTEGEAGASNDIIVTGSRIARRDLSSNSPLVTLSAEALKNANAVTLDDALNRLPQVTPSFGSGSNDVGAGGVTTVGLRGLGAPRTLVLVDGRRLTAGSFTGAADVNIVPKSLIESVDVITGGASAAYGSDAVAGVVNFRLKRNFEGVLLSAQSGITERGDGMTFDGSFTVGGNFSDDRGNAVLALDYSHRDGVNSSAREFSRVSRPSSLLPFGAYVPSALNLPTAAAINGVFANYGVAPGSVPPSRSLGFNNNGTLFSSTGSFNYRGGADNIVPIGSNVFFNSAGINGLIIPFERYGLFGRAEYEVIDGVRAYAEISYQNYESQTVFAPGFTDSSVPVTNPFIPADLRTVLNSRPNPAAPFTMSRRYADVGARSARVSTDGYRVVAGVTGALEAIDGTWDIYASRGHQAIKQQDRNGFSISALNSLLNAADGGASRCAGGFNPFGANANTACAAFIRRNSLRESETSQDIVEATIQGRLFKLPAGDVRFAIGADHRRDSYDFVPDSGLAAGDVVSFASGIIPAVSGVIKVAEVYGELLVPLLRDIPLIQELNLNVGYRYSDYNTSGGVSSYRAEGDWRIIDAVRVRGSYARAVRSPNVYELFSPNGPVSPIVGSPGAVGQGDPCDIRSAYRTGANGARVRALCLAQGMPTALIDSYTFNNTQIVDGGLTGGNPNLTPETADTYTAGIVFTPKFDSALFRNVSLSIDYYDIRLKQAIGTIGGASIIQSCYNLAGQNSSYAIDNVYCGFMGRSAETGQINNLSAFNLNLGKIETAGIDVTFQTTLELGETAGSIDLGGTVNWTDKFAVSNFPGSTPVDMSGSIGGSAGSSAGVPAAFPKWKAAVNLTYRNGPFQIGAQYRYIDSMIDASAVNVANSTAIGTPAYHYVDLNAQVKATDALTFRIGVTNVGDKQPPVYTSFYQSNTYPGVYDVLGRSYYVGAAVKF